MLAGMHLLALHHVLVATDLEESSAAAVEAARRLAEAAGATLHAVHVTAPMDQTRDTHPSSRSVRTLEEALSEAGARVDDRNTHVVGGDPAYAIGSLADRIGASVIVLGPHRERREERPTRNLGGTALNIITTAAAPCLIVSQPLALPLRSVLVPVDLSDTARGALLVGLSWTSALRANARTGPGGGATMTALYVDAGSRGADGATTSANPFDRELESVREVAGSWAQVTIKGARSTSADVARGILDFAAESHPDLVVLGTRGTGFDRTGRLGSIAAAVTRQLSVPVLLVPPAVWSSIGKSV
jgi:universal stress protein E